MDINCLWSIRLGFSSAQSKKIQDIGILNFLEESFISKFDLNEPLFLQESPKTFSEFKEYKERIKSLDNNPKTLNNSLLKSYFDLKGWWIEKMRSETYPLREKMVLFWHNHYVATSQKVKVPYWIYTHNQLLRKEAFGNFRELTKQVLKTNAMVVYLDNNQNKKDNYNENLSRELLELFTLGVGNYTEDDIKNGAIGLAGLDIGDKGASYNLKKESNTEIVYFGRKGHFKSDEMVDIIFSHKNAPYLITKKILQWFIYDNPPEDLVTYYGNYLKKVDFEIKPLLTKIFEEEYTKNTAGSKIKDPITYIMQILNELEVKNFNPKLIATFIRNQGMDLFEQINVKGWEGGKSWLTGQLFLQRNNTANNLCKGKSLNSGQLKTIYGEEEYTEDNIDITLEWNKKGNNKDIIEQLKNRLLFNADENLQQNFESILKYDFNPELPGAENGVMRLFNYMIKTPEFQVI